jgi:hypothetical protein
MVGCISSEVGRSYSVAMSNHHYCRLQHIAKILIDAREDLERSDLINFPDANTLHALISQAHWLCTNIAQHVRREEVRVAAATAISGASNSVRLLIWDGLWSDQMSGRPH